MADEPTIGHRWQRYTDEPGVTIACTNCGTMMQRVETGRAIIRMYWVNGIWTANKPTCEAH